MTWLDDDAGIETSQPREGLEIKHGNTAHRIATGTRDITINGNTFEARPGERASIKLPSIEGNQDFSFSLAVAHAFVRRYIASPPMRVDVTLWRQQPSGVRLEWSGTVRGLEISGNVATFTCFSILERAIRRRLPVYLRGKQCPYVLYDVNCKVARNSSTRVATTVASYSNTTVTVASIGGSPDGWATLGELLHIPSGERMTIAAQTGTVLKLPRAIYELRDGDAVHVFAGCNRTIEVCASKFNNAVNFGGDPHMPSGDLYRLGVTRLYQSE